MTVRIMQRRADEHGYDDAVWWKESGDTAELWSEAKRCLTENKNIELTAVVTNLYERKLFDELDGIDIVTLSKYNEISVN